MGSASPSSTPRDERKGRTRLVDTLRHQVIDEDTDKPVRSTQRQLLLPDGAPSSVDTSQDALRCRFLVSRRAVDLTSEEETSNTASLEGVCGRRKSEKAQYGLRQRSGFAGERRKKRTLQLPRVDVVVLDSVARLNHLDFLETGNRSKQLELVLSGKGDGDAIRVDKVCEAVSVSHRLTRSESVGREREGAPESYPSGSSHTV